MSKKRRTKRQKIKAKKRTQTLSKTASTKKPAAKNQAAVATHSKQQTSSIVSSQTKVTKKTSIEEPSLFRYDKRLIYKDLLKSLLITLFIFALLIGVYFWVK